MLLLPLPSSANPWSGEILKILCRYNWQNSVGGLEVSGMRGKKGIKHDWIPGRVKLPIIR